MSLSALYFDSINVKDLGGSIEISPNFICPKCVKYVDGKISTDSSRCTLSACNLTKMANRESNFNQKVMFKMPCCGTEISLYVAVHKPADKNDLAFRISVEPIPDDWWRSRVVV